MTEHSKHLKTTYTSFLVRITINQGAVCDETKAIQRILVRNVASGTKHQFTNLMDALDFIQSCTNE